MVEKSFQEPWDQLLFRDYLIQHSDVARQYERAKMDLASKFVNDRVSYTNGKTEFIAGVMRRLQRL